MCKFMRYVDVVCICDEWTQNIENYEQKISIHKRPKMIGKKAKNVQIINLRQLLSSE